ncbi:MAG: hypothetical protein JG718_17615 [Candidatus Thiothrix moscowensis]|nr:hypothetical protein [Candidatus Thiothrix moscowensis]
MSVETSPSRLTFAEYRFLFRAVDTEVREDVGILKTVSTFPVPYVFQVQRQQARRLAPGDWFSVKLLLVAHANHYVRSIIIEAMQLAEQGGLGKGYGRAALQEVMQLPVCGNASVIYTDGVFFRTAALEPPAIPRTSHLCPHPFHYPCQSGRSR